MVDLSRSYERFSKELADLVITFQQRTADELLQPKDQWVLDISAEVFLFPYFLIRSGKIVGGTSYDWP